MCSVFFCCVLFYFSVQLVINFLLAFDIFHALLLLLLLLLRCCCFKLSFFGVLFCAAQSIIGGRAREGKNESGRQRVRERAKGRETSAISAFPAKWSKQFAIDFFVCYCYSFFYNFNFNYTNAVRTKERRKKKKQETRKIKIANWRRRQRNVEQLGSAQRSAALPSVVSWLFVFVRCFISFFVFITTFVCAASHCPHWRSGIAISRAQVCVRVCVCEGEIIMSVCVCVSVAV